MRIPAHSLVTGDLHLSSNPRDDYRWGIFPVLQDLCRKHHISYLFILGDLTEAKDNHPASFLNRLVDELAYMGQIVNRVILLMGNHDGIEPSVPYFRFLNHLDAVDYYFQPTVIGINGRRLVMLPHTVNPGVDWRPIYRTDMIDAAMAHITVTGAMSPTGALRGIPMEAIERLGCPMLSGDVHVPQQLGDVTYVGAPYHKNFGDNYEGRVLLKGSNSSELESLSLSGKFPDRHRLEIGSLDDFYQLLDDEEIKGDQVKVRLTLRPNTMDQWQALTDKIKKELETVGCDIMGFEYSLEDVVGESLVVDAEGEGRSPVEIFEEYVTRKGLIKQIAAAGRECLDKAKG